MPSHRTPSSIRFCVEQSRNLSKPFPLNRNYESISFKITSMGLRETRKQWSKYKFSLAASTWLMLLRCSRSPAHLEALSLSAQQNWSEAGGVWVGCRRRGEGDIAGDCRGGGLSRVTFAGAAAGDLSLLQQHSHWLAAPRGYPSQDIALISIHWLDPEPGGKLVGETSKPNQ